MKNDEKERLIKYLEDSIKTIENLEQKFRKNRIPKSYEIAICVGEQNAYQDILERIKKGRI